MATIDLAFSEAAVQSMFNTLRDSVHITKSGSTGGAFSASYNAGIRLAGGTIDLKDLPDELKLNELDVIYDPLNVTLSVDIPEVCVGGFCLVWVPFLGCIVRAPRICLFSSNPDISIPINMNGLIQSEISGAFEILTQFFDNPAGAGMNPYQAAAANVADKWRFFLRARWIDLDIIDISDTIGNILDSIIDNFINNIFAGLPGWARDILSWMLHGIADIIRTILNIEDNIDEWISDLLGVSFGLFDYIVQQVSNNFLAGHPIYQFDTPYPIGGILLPINNVSTDIAETEMVLSITI
jgi:hypothetical protein